MLNNNYNEITRIHMDVAGDESVSEVIEKIRNTYGPMDPREKTVYSAVVTRPKNKDTNYKLSLSLIEGHNSYTLPEALRLLFCKSENKQGFRYLNPPLEEFILVYDNLLKCIVTEAHHRYKNVFPDKDDITSLLYLTLVKLHKKDYFLHTNIITFSLYNELNMECRKHKNDYKLYSLTDENTQDILDTFIDPLSDFTAKVEEDDYDAKLLREVKAAMLENMSELSYDIILIKLASHTIDTPTSRVLAKYREMFTNKGGKR